MVLFLILMGAIFLFLVYRNMKAGLDRYWLIWTLVTIAGLVGLLYLSEYIDCLTNKNTYCGAAPTLIWIYAAPVVVCLGQLVYLNRKRI